MFNYSKKIKSFKKTVKKDYYSNFPQSVSDAIFSRLNWQIGFWYHKGIIFGVTLCYFALYYFNSLDDEAKKFNAWLLFFIYACPLFVFLFFYVASIVKWRDYILIRKIVLLQIRNSKSNSAHYLAIAFIKSTCAFLFYFIISLLPVILTISKHENSFFQVFPSFVGFYIVLVVLTFIASYGVAALPQMIRMHTKNDKYKFIYWFYFIKSRLLLSNQNFFLCLPVFFIICTVLIVLPFLNTKLNIKHFEWEILIDIEYYSLTVGIIALWMSALFYMVNDIVKNYLQLYKTFSEYTNHQIRNHIINEHNIRYILIGYGCLGKVIAKSLFVSILKNTIDSNKLNFSNFEIVTDSNFNLRIIPREIAVVEQDTTIFEELCIDQDSGLSYGFLHDKELESFHTKKAKVLNGCSNDEFSENSYIPSFALFGIKGDGGNFPVLSLADIEKSEIIINTTSDKDMGLRLKKLLDQNVSDSKKPVVITNVEDSTSCAFLSRSRNSSFFPLHTARIEGWLIGTRLFMLLLKLIPNENEITNVKLLILGNGKSLFYILQSLIRHMFLSYKSNFIESFMEHNVILITNDPIIKGESTLDNKESIKRIWKVSPQHSINYNMSVIFGEFTSIYNIKMALQEAGVSEGNYTIFTITSQIETDVLRTLEHIKVVLGSDKMKGFNIVSSISNKMELDFKKSISRISCPKSNIKSNGFPANINDLILRKNYIIGNRIMSIAELMLKNNKRTPGIHRRKSDIEINREFYQETGELSICNSNKPLSLATLLTRLSGFKGLCYNNLDVNMVPSFFNSYSYPVKWNVPLTSDTFLFRSFCFLTEINENFNETMFNIDGVAINGPETFEKKSLKYFSKLGRAGDGKCIKYNHRCPISSSYSVDNCISDSKIVHEHKIVDNENYATVKIWGDLNNVPGALALAISDFLMAGKGLKTARLESDPGVCYDISYENCRICSFGKVLNRFYVSLRDDKSALREKEELLTNRNILAVLIKPTDKTSKKWDDYASHLLIYLNSFKERAYEKSVVKKGILIVDKNLKKDLRYRSFFNESFNN